MKRLGKPLGIAVHPAGHEVAADARLRMRAFGHLGAGVVRAARAEVRHALDRIGSVGQQLRRREVAHVLQMVAERLVVRKVARDPVRDDLDQARGPQLAECRYQRRTLCIALADDHRPLALRRVVEQVAQLRLERQHAHERLQQRFGTGCHQRWRLGNLCEAQPARRAAGRLGSSRERAAHRDRPRGNSRAVSDSDRAAEISANHRRRLVCIASPRGIENSEGARADCGGWCRRKRRLTSGYAELPCTPGAS